MLSPVMRRSTSSASELLTIDQLSQRNLDVRANNLVLVGPLTCNFLQKWDQRTLDQKSLGRVPTWQRRDLRCQGATRCCGDIEEQRGLTKRHRAADIGADDKQPAVESAAAAILDRCRKTSRRTEPRSANPKRPRPAVGPTRRIHEHRCAPPRTADAPA